MTATVVIKRLTGGSAGSPANSDAITSSNDRANAIDQHNPGTTSPVKIPATGSGPNYSYWVNTCLEVTDGSWTTINNVFWYTEDTSSPWGTGISGLVGYTTQDGYRPATGSVGVTGNELNSSNYATISGVTQDMFTYGASTAFSGLDSNGLGTINSGVNTASYIVAYQMSVYPTASPGPSSESGNIVWSYDEV